MKIIADENMPLIDTLFGELGTVKRLSGREISHDDVRDADLLLVRSVTQVNAELLENSSIRFVGTATIGTDHIDKEYLHRNAIEFADAAGCNAQAVAEYVLAALAVWSRKHNKPLDSICVGIIGAGNVGTALAHALKALGINYVLNDPLLEQSNDPRAFASIEQIQQCEVITCHVPLTVDTEHSTHHLIAADFLQKIPENSLVINAARGAVVDNRALRAHKLANSDFEYVLDVWEDEPQVDAEVLEHALIGTPHIAGYSVQGKIRGSYLLYQQYMDKTSQVSLKPMRDFMPNGVTFSWPPLALFSETILQCYDILQDDRALRTAVQTTENADKISRAKAFDTLRKNYRQRLEFLPLEL